MKVPRLNRRMVLETRVAVPNGSGGFAVDWQGLGAHWVAVEAGAGRVDGGEALVTGAVPCRIVVRAGGVGSDQRPVPGQRFREAGRVFAIQAVVEGDPDGRYLTCFAREEVPA